MPEIVPLLATHVEEFSRSITRSHLPFNEYQMFSDQALREFWKAKTLKFLQSEKNHALALIEDNRLSGMLLGSKDEFDSGIFGFDCYRISELLLLSDVYNKTQINVQHLLQAFESEIFNQNSPVYLFFSLNNNLPNIDQLFNSLIINNFYFLHTLLTFASGKEKFSASEYYEKDKLRIRLARKDDVRQVAELAQNSFRYSRFHLDPFLDDVKANLLLKTSAENSIIHGFVDALFVAEIEDKIVGYHSGKLRPLEGLNTLMGEVVYTAVDAAYRGMGIFKKLDNHVINWFADNTDFAEMGTYLVNYPVHRTWIEKKLRLVRGSHQFSKFILP